MRYRIKYATALISKGMAWSFFAALSLNVSGCSLAHTLKTVETVPKGESRSTVGIGVWFTDESAFYSDSGSLAGGPEASIEPVIGYSFRHGILDHFEIGFSADPPWPGIGGKVRLTDWFAFDANLKFLFPIYENFPPPGIFYDASLLFGRKQTYFGVKYLSDGMVPGTEGRSSPDGVLFLGHRFGFLIPEAMFLARNREVAFAMGIVF